MRLFPRIDLGRKSEPQGVLIQPIGAYKGVEGLHQLFAAAALSPSRRDHGATLMALRRAKRKGLNPRQRLAPAAEGGNWKGAEYLTYAERDFCKRMAMKHGERKKGSNAPLYARAVSILIAERAARRAAA